MEESITPTNVPITLEEGERILGEYPRRLPLLQILIFTIFPPFIWGILLNKMVKRRKFVLSNQRLVLLKKDKIEREYRINELRFLRKRGFFANRRVRIYKKGKLVAHSYYHVKNTSDLVKEANKLIKAEKDS